MTNETKHTATPWEVLPERGSYDINGAINPVMVGVRHTVGQENIANCADHPNAKANAAHIVKCVNAHDDLVEALEQTKRFIEFMPKGIGRGAASPLMQKIEAALKKASE